jgi:hypothetical protein
MLSGACFSGRRSACATKMLSDMKYCQGFRAPSPHGGASHLRRVCENEMAKKSREYHVKNVTRLTQRTYSAMPRWEAHSFASLPIAPHSHRHRRPSPTLLPTTSRNALRASPLYVARGIHLYVARGIFCADALQQLNTAYGYFLVAGGAENRGKCWTFLWPGAFLWPLAFL